jgi:hypothetical protein
VNRTRGAMQEEEERQLLERFDVYCANHFITTSFTSQEKKKLIQMIQMLEKLRQGNPIRYEGTLKRMGLEKILDQTNTEISIFDAILAFYGAAKTNQTVQIKDKDKDKIKEKEDLDDRSFDLFEEIKMNQWNVILRVIQQNSQAVKTPHPKYGLPLHYLCSKELDYCPSLEVMTTFVTLFPSGLFSFHHHSSHRIHFPHSHSIHSRFDNDLPQWYVSSSYVVN